MPSPGDLLALSYQWQLADSGTLYGAGSHSTHLEYGKTIGGLGGPTAKTQDVPFNFGDGSYANPDHLTMRVITIPAVVRAPGNPNTAMVEALSLGGVWAPVATDVSLAFQFPGPLKFYLMGRPREAVMDTTDVDKGAVYLLLRFDCPDPTINLL
jgi:hypothetical protein